MNRFFKRTLSMILAVLMIFGSAPQIVSAMMTEETAVCEDEHCEEHFHEEEITETVEIVLDSGDEEKQETEYTHALPESKGVENAIARAYSLTDVEWTPLADVSGVQKIDGVYKNIFFKAGETYKGIPYSGVIPTDTYVGLNVSLESFVTALENKNSVLYTENLHSSSYPKASAYFGTVCSKFVQYALNVPGSFNTNNVANIPGMETVVLPGEYTVDDIKLGDVVLHTKNHTTICTDILYDSEGKVAFVEISEAVLPLCRRLLWSPEEFYEHFEGYRLCRYQYIDEVPAPTEFDAEEKHALMPRFGNKYNYKVSSSDGNVDILEKGYSKAVVLRDGAVIDEISIDDSTETFGFDRSVPGKIEMYLEKEDGTKSGSVFAMVVDSSVTVIDSASFLGGKLTVEYCGTSGKPLYVQLGSGQNMFCKVDEEELSGKAVIKIKNPSSVSDYKARIAFENEFGIYLSSYSKFTVDLSGGTGPNPSGDPLLSKAVYWDGYNITPGSHIPVIQENKVGYWSYTEIPVEGNTEYYSNGATRLWYLDANKKPISTYNAYKESKVPCSFKTPENCEFVSIAYSSNIIEQGTENIRLLSTSAPFSTVSEAALALREKMIARESPATIRVAKGILPSEVLAKAWEHNGTPNGGDYIRHNQIGQSYTTVSGEDENGAYTEITYTFNWLTTAEQEAEVDAAVDAVLAELDLWEKTDYEKIKGVYDWITENVQYDFNNEDDDEYTLCHSTYAAIVQKEAVCQGYATLFYRMMLELGVDSRYIRGMAGYVEIESHAWNIVALDGKYYNMDATWDRDLMGHYRMFLCTEANFTEHIPDSEYTTAEWKAKYPMAVVPYVFNVAASGKLSNGMEWVLDGDTGTLTVAGKGAIPSYRYNYAPWYNYKDSVKSIVISEGITEVGERAFYWCVNCTSLSLPSTLTAIREYGFNNLRNLEYVTLPENLRIMEFCAFSECVALKEIVIPDSVTTCGTSAFSNCYGLKKAVIGNGLKVIPDSMFFADKNLREVTLPDGLTEIGDTAFADCGLFYFTIPASLRTLGSSVFSGCRNLYDFTVDAGNQYYKAIGGVLFTKDGKTLVSYPGGDIASYYYVPNGTEIIARSAFNEAYRLEHVYFPDSLREIKPYAFAYCNALWSVIFTPNITRIGDSAFRSCKGLYSAIFENPDVVLEASVFADCDTMEFIYLPSRLREIPNGLFYGSQRLSEVEIPSTVTKIGSSAFLDCDSLKTITVPGTVKSVEQQAFDYCDKLETIIFEEGVQRIGWLAIRNNPKLKKVVIPSSVTTFERPSGTSDKTFDACPNVVVYVNCGTAGWNYVRNYGISYSASHPYTNSTVVQPTCTSQGYTRYYCNCGTYSYNSNYTSALGHSYNSYVTPPTCTEEGYTTYTCRRCGYSYNGNYVPENGHSLVLTGYVEPTCTEPGYSGDEVCSVCGTIYYGEEIPETGHDFVSGICVKCGETKKPYQRITYFSVEVEAENGKTYSDNAVLYLPKNYSINGEPVKLVIYCKQGATQITSSSNPIESVGFYNYLLNLGYAILGVDGVPDAWRDELVIGERAVGNPLAVRGTEKAYDYVVENYNIASDGCFISGYSQGGHYTQNVIDLTDIPILAAAEQSPVCSMRYHQWDLNATVTVGGVKFTKGARVNVARIYGFPAFSTNDELLKLEYNPALVDAYDPWVRNSKNVYTEFVQKGNLWYLPEGTSVDDITMSHSVKCPVKIWCAEDDTAVSADVMKVFVKAIQNGGGIAEISVAKSGGHGFFQNQPAIGSFTENGKQYKTLPIAVEIAEWFERFGGYSCVHNFVLKNYSEPTCTEPGYSGDEVCSVCGTTYYGEEIPETGHFYDEHVTPPTCTEQGYTEYICLVCGESYIENYVPALGHNYTAETVYPYKLTKGYTSYICSVCSDTYRTPWLDSSAYEGKTIACIGDSITAGVGVTKDENDYVTLLAEELGMNYIRLGVSGTTLCTGGHRKCNIDKLTEANLRGADVVTIMMGINDFDQAKEGYYMLGNIDSTDTSTIYGAARMWCERIVELRKTESLSDTQFYFVTPVITSWNHSVADGRNWDQSKKTIHGYTLRDLCNAIIEVAALYDIPVIDQNLISGLYYNSAEDNTIDKFIDNFGGDGVHPSVTGHAMMADALANALLQNDLRDDHEHEFGSWITTDYPSCQPGEESRVCSVCTAVETNAIAANGKHSYISAVTEPDCTEQGYTTYTCIYCGESYIDNYVPALGHTEGETVIENSVAPTCGKDGSHDEVVYCEVCGEELSRKTVVDKATGDHVYSIEKERVEPTCTEDGYFIMACGCGATQRTEIPALGHTEVTDKAVAPTCTETGLTEGKHCSVCGEILVKQNVVPALGHTEVIDKAVAPTCTETGLTEGKHCSVCGEVLVKPNVVPALGHTEVVDKAVAPTCTETGLTEGKHCSVCEEVLVKQNVVPALGHTEVIDKAVAPTCTETGLTEGKHCSVCGEVLAAQEIVPATGHNYESVITEPTCTEQGYTTHTCSVCGDSYVDFYVEATGHSFGEWYTVTEASCSEAGEERRDCKNCDYYETQEIPPKGYEIGDINLDGKVDVMDAYYIRLVVAKLRKPTEQQILLGDVDLDGKITAIDANIIRKFAVKMITELPVK